ncbi:MAG: amidohydrolase [Deltaproteobacteria bacterium]|nr:amidohydrolase [Deltaproteobacteria bacterium]
MLIDAHMHIGTWDHPDFLGRTTTVADAVAVLDSSGLDGAALLPTDRCDNQGLLSDMQAALRSGYRGSLWFFPWVKPGDDEGLSWVRTIGASATGLKIHPSLSRMRVTDNGFRPHLDLAEERDLVVLVHCGRWQEIASYRFAVEAAERHPRARFLLAHGGGDTPPLGTAACDLVAEKRLDNVWFEFSGVREYWVIERNVRKLGAERYLMGSDYNLAHPKMYLGAVDGMNLPESDKQRIRGGNAAQLFGAALEVEA